MLKKKYLAVIIYLSILHDKKLIDKYLSVLDNVFENFKNEKSKKRN